MHHKISLRVLRVLHLVLKLVLKLLVRKLVKLVRKLLVVKLVKLVLKLLVVKLGVSMGSALDSRCASPPSSCWQLFVPLQASSMGTANEAQLGPGPACVPQLGNTDNLPQGGHL